MLVDYDLDTTKNKLAFQQWNLGQNPNPSFGPVTGLQNVNRKWFGPGDINFGSFIEQGGQIDPRTEGWNRSFPLDWISNRKPTVYQTPVKYGEIQPYQGREFL